MIKPDTLAFLHSLAANNIREWFQDNKAEYEVARENVLAFTAEIIKGLAKVDPAIPADLEAKNCLMRIYRDIRFSKDKTPYKLNFGIAISETGKNFNGPGYYINIQPSKCFIAAGHWQPDPEHLKAIRQEIDYNGSEFRSIIGEPSFAKNFGALSSEDKLKTVPKGYDSSHPDIELLKLKSFEAYHQFNDKDFQKPASAIQIVDMFESLLPFMVFLRNAIA